MTVQHHLKRDHSRAFRILMGFVIAVLLVVAPQIAQATFTSSSTANLSVGTLKLAAPASLTGTYKCPSLFQQNVGLVGFQSAAVAGARGYAARLTSSNGDDRTIALTSLTGSVRVKYYVFESVTWTLTVEATAGPWSGPTKTASFKCGAFNPGSGSIG